MTSPFFLGIDIGTQGARAVLVDARGTLISSQKEGFILNKSSRKEQSPGEWWHACVKCLQRLITDARDKISLADIQAASVTSTSGTVIPLDRNDLPLHNAIMYSDTRSIKEGELCKDLALEHHPEGYTGFNSSSGLAKMVWFCNNFPEKAKKIARWVHATDFITGKLTCNWGISDYTNVLKSGYDLHKYEWPSYLFTKLPLQEIWLPKVVPPGTVVGTIDVSVAKLIGLYHPIQVVAGMTDGCASQIASGAMKPGDWNTTIGTTLVVKGVTSRELKDPESRLYNHRHPDGFWMPGGAANIGADWVSSDFGNDLDMLNANAKNIIPTGFFAYPLRQTGERFPFVAPNARGFEPKGITTLERFTASMEGVAYVERYAYEMIENLSGEKVQSVFTAGGASDSDVWLTIRSNVLNLPIYKMKYVTGAVGAAILASSNTYFTSIIEATRALTQIEKEIIPKKELSEKYDFHYQHFIEILYNKGYIKKEQHA